MSATGFANNYTSGFGVERASTPTIMVNTPDGTRKPNGITPPQTGKKYSSAAGSTVGIGSGERGGKGGAHYSYNPTDDFGPEMAESSDHPQRWERQRTSPAPSGTNRFESYGPSPKEKGTTVKHHGASVMNGGGNEQYLNLHSPSPMGIQDSRRKYEPGSAASFYGGTPPTFPPPPDSMNPAATAEAAEAYNISGTLSGGVGDGGGGGGYQGSVVSMPGPAAPGIFSSSAVPSLYQGRERGLRAARVDAESALRDYLDLQQRVRLGASSDDKERLKRASGRAFLEVKELRKEIGLLVKKKEGGRIGRFIVGGIVAGTIPIIKRFFRRPHGSRSAKTEYAYEKSQSMVSRILSALHRTGWAASIFMFVLAALYVFQAEVMIRVAKTVHKRLKKLLIKMEEGESLGKDGMVVMDPKDLDCLKGWRWRVLLWTK